MQLHESIGVVRESVMAERQALDRVGLGALELGELSAEALNLAAEVGVGLEELLVVALHKVLLLVGALQRRLRVCV